MGLPLPLPGTMGHCGIWHGGWGRAASRPHEPESCSAVTAPPQVSRPEPQTSTGPMRSATIHPICLECSPSSSVVQRKSGLVRVFIFP